MLRQCARINPSIVPTLDITCHGRRACTLEPVKEWVCLVESYSVL